SNCDDPPLAKDNSGPKMPDLRIITLHRAESSGTSFIFTDYLSKVSHDWHDGPGNGASVNWPSGIGAKRHEGVAGMVRQMPGTIGYVELIYALQNHISF